MSDAHSESAPPGRPVLALVASVGAGGGIEAYVDGVLEHLDSPSHQLQILPLSGASGRPSVPDKLGFALRAGWAARRLRGRLPAILCFHVGLLPVALLCRWIAGRESTLRVFCYGADIWGPVRGWRRAARRADLGLVTISEFSAGALVALQPSAVLPPAVPRTRFAALLRARRETTPASGTLRVLTVFRLTDFEPKGGDTVVRAVEGLRADGEDVTLTVAGKGEAGSALDEQLNLRARPWLRIRRDPTEAELVDLYASADLFVLATRLRTGRDPRGEGFGIVLLEASLAGVPVVAPWGGGGHAAILEGITGLRPADESVGALTDLLRWASHHRDDLEAMGRNARTWTSRAFAPEKYANRVQELVFGGTTDPAGALSLHLTSDPQC